MDAVVAAGAGPAAVAAEGLPERIPQGAPGAQGVPGTEQLLIVIDDDYAMRLSCRQILGKAGYRVAAYADGAQGLAAVARLRPALVIVDLKMPGLSGFEVLRRVHELDPTIVVVVITGYATIETAIETMKAGAYDFLPKPFSPDQLRLLVARGLERRRLQLASSALEVEREMLRRRFVSFVSHQLKTPLAAIHQALDVLRRLEGSPDVATKRAGWIDRCLERTTEARSLIDDWLTLSRIEADSLVGRREPVDLGALLSHLVETQRERAAEHEVTVELVLPATGPRVEGDPTCLGVLFENLLDNAVKYNRPGGSVKVEAAADRDGDGEVAVVVRDTGEGIPEEALPFLFDEFFRAQAARGKVRGSGLGLAICRRIATEMGGTIDVESTPGAGSTFRVRLPIQQGREIGVEPSAAAVEVEHEAAHETEPRAAAQKTEHEGEQTLEAAGATPPVDR
jgi:two-component system, sensor histidine kinase and response regulator